MVNLVEKKKRHDTGVRRNERPLQMTQLQSLTSLKEDWIEQPIVCTRPNLKPGYVDRRHLGSLRAGSSVEGLGS